MFDPASLTITLLTLLPGESLRAMVKDALSLNKRSNPSLIFSSYTSPSLMLLHPESRSGDHAEGLLQGKQVVSGRLALLRI